VGDGCTIAGAWKGLKEMKELGFISRLPRMLGVQAKGAAPLYDAFKKGQKRIDPVEAKTIADSIAVGQPRNWRKALTAIEESRGAMVTVEDEEILEAMRITARMAAVFSEPAGAAAVAGLVNAVKQGVVSKSERALAVLTGNGLKDTKSAIQATTPPIDVAPELKALDAELHERRLV
jgi:threonine synthase